jgi:hypothetical protein
MNEHYRLNENLNHCPRKQQGCRGTTFFVFCMDTVWLAYIVSPWLCILREQPSFMAGAVELPEYPQRTHSDMHAVLSCTESEPVGRHELYDKLKPHMHVRLGLILDVQYSCKIRASFFSYCKRHLIFYHILIRTSF